MEGLAWPVVGNCLSPDGIHVAVGDIPRNLDLGGPKRTHNIPFRGDNKQRRPVVVLVGHNNLWRTYYSGHPLCLARIKNRVPVAGGAFENHQSDRLAT